MQHGTAAHISSPSRHFRIMRGMMQSKTLHVCWIIVSSFVLFGDPLSEAILRTFTARLCCYCEARQHAVLLKPKLPPTKMHLRVRPRLGRPRQRPTALARASAPAGWPPHTLPSPSCSRARGTRPPHLAHAHFYSRADHLQRIYHRPATTPARHTQHQIQPSRWSESHSTSLVWPDFFGISGPEI